LRFAPGSLDVDAAWYEDVEPLLAAGYDPARSSSHGAQQGRKAAALRTYGTQFAALEADGRIV
jgi:hypothetical protein